ncbi:MAG: hypothetical protein D6731_21810 [Planctomycetota bacterium]|nr:MAG: hypothetical protein D6731_21810 [Planctomycetota bacterium]
MKMDTFLERVPEAFATEILAALPGPDRKDLVRRHGARVKIGAGTLKRAQRLAKECRLLLSALRKSDDVDAKRSFLQGWLARRAQMIVAFLDAWEVEHQGGIVEDFSWVESLDAEKVKRSLETVREQLPDLEPVAPLVYFAYLELPVTEEVLDVEALWRSLTPAAAEG